MAKKHPLLHVGDTRTAISRTLKQPNESNVLTVVDLTGTTVTFRMINKADGSVKVAGAAVTIDDAANGQVSYALQAADVDTAGIFLVYFIVTEGGATDHFPSETGEDLIYIGSDTEAAEAAYQAAL